MNATMLERLRLEADLRQAITRDELRVYFQPTISLGTGRVIGMEALVRWMHPTRGLLGPGSFIPLAEEAGLIRPLGRWVLAHACSQLRSWQANPARTDGLVLNVNLSAQEFQHPDLVSDIGNVLEEYEIPPHHLQFEITESVAMSDAAATHSKLRQLKELGVQLAIDDFGTGYSSLSYLKRFPVDTLKVDKSFVDGLGSDPEDTAIVAAVVALGKALGLNVIAEGIESQEVVDRLQEISCEYGQGYHFAEPLPSDAFEDLWANDLLITSDWRTRRAS
ncbi:MAG: EAL domain-containing protein [Candidatus Eisenbacteria bacterium]